jgi:hypothetical protein
LPLKKWAKRIPYWVVRWQVLIPIFDFFLVSDFMNVIYQKCHPVGSRKRIYRMKS